MENQTTTEVLKKSFPGPSVVFILPCGVSDAKTSLSKPYFPPFLGYDLGDENEDLINSFVENSKSKETLRKTEQCINKFRAFVEASGCRLFQNDAQMNKNVKLFASFALRSDGYPHMAHQSDICDIIFRAPCFRAKQRSIDLTLLVAGSWLPLLVAGGCLGPPLISRDLTGRFSKFKRQSIPLKVIYISKK